MSVNDLPTFALMVVGMALATVLFFVIWALVVRWLIPLRVPRPIRNLARLLVGGPKVLRRERVEHLPYRGRQRKASDRRE